MEDGNNKRWPLSLVVLAILGSMTLLGFLSLQFLPSGTGAVSPPRPDDEGVQTASYVHAPSNWTDDTGASLYRPVKKEMILHRDIGARVGNTIVTYRGLGPESNLKLDVIVIELDPDVTYSRDIDIVRAKNGFQLGEESLQLISARKLRLYVWHYD